MEADREAATDVDVSEPERERGRDERTDDDVNEDDDEDDDTEDGSASERDGATPEPVARESLVWEAEWAIWAASSSSGAWSHSSARSTHSRVICFSCGASHCRRVRASQANI